MNVVGGARWPYYRRLTLWMTVANISFGEIYAENAREILSNYQGPTGLGGRTFRLQLNLKGTGNWDHPVRHSNLSQTLIEYGIISVNRED